MNLRSSIAKAIAVFLFVVAAAPLAIYPAVFLADIMSLGGHRRGDEPLLLVCAGLAALLSSLFYPVVYFSCLRWAIRHWGEGLAAVFGGLAAVLYLVLTIASFCLWFLVSD